MNPEFLGADYLLTTPIARQLYHEVAAGLPIVDVHNHLSPIEIASDHRWETITELWLGHDHYKWKAMRAAGFDEALISGDADPWDRFEAWAATLPRLIGNPLYVWTHLELRRAFGIDGPLTPRTAASIWEQVNAQLADTTALGLLQHFGVEIVATTDGPPDDLANHIRHRASGSSPMMVPTYRPDSAHALLDRPDEWNAWADRLAVAEGTAIQDLDSLLTALGHSFDRFAAIGCRASDHGLACLPDLDRDSKTADAALRRARDGGAATAHEQQLVLLEVVAHAARKAAANDSVLQLHLGPVRNVSPRLIDLIGRDAGADVIGDERQAPGLIRFLAGLEAAGELPRTVLYNLNPADNVLFATLAGAFARPGVAALVQWGPPWWFNDHEHGMRRHLDDLADVGMLASFIGMLTDSRSILSMTRHELFRRVLCAKLGEGVAAGSVVPDIEWLSQVVADLSVGNTRRFFGFEAP